MKFPQLRDLLADHFTVEPESITPETRLREELGADSLDFVEITYAIEEQMGCDLSAAVMEDLETVAQLLTYLEAAS